MISKAGDLGALCARVREDGVFGIDMEFQRETTYWPILQLIQVAVADEVVLVDPLALDDLSPLYALVGDPGVRTIFHAGGQDMEIVYHRGGVLPANVFDTQIAAALVGFGDQPGYAPLVARVLGARLTKLETGTDWSRRPLTPAQVAYAQDDVLHLLELHERLGSKLAALGRTEWAAEEMSHYAEDAFYRPDPRRMYLRVRRAGRLGSRELAVLRELAAWREEEAARRDRPRGRVISDDLIIDIARRAPTSIDQLRELRQLHSKEVARSGEAVLGAVARALALPREEWPKVQRQPRDEAKLAPARDLLEVVLRARAEEASIGPSYLGTQQDIADLLEYVRTGNGPEPPLLTGWRRDVVGEDLLDVARGRSSLSIDAVTGRVVRTRLEA